MKRLAFLALAFSAAASAQPPRPLEFDPRIETLQWKQGAELALRTAPGSSLMLIFAPGEAVQQVTVGDPAAVEVQVAPQADGITLRTLRSPANPLLNVRTQLRDYRFAIRVGAANDVAYAVRFAVGEPNDPVPLAADPPSSAIVRYSIKGEKTLRPVRVTDDGAKTYIQWLDDQPLPAVFALNSLGEEETVDSYMRQGITVIDRVYDKLVFRVGKRSATASRIAPAKGK